MIMGSSEPPSKKSKLSKKCTICCSSLLQEGGKDKTPQQLPSTDPKVLFHQFCEKFLQNQEKKLWRGLSVCSSCTEHVCTVLDTRSKMELVEGRARKLQWQLLQELKELKMYVDLLTWQLGKIENCVKESGPNDHAGWVSEGDKLVRKCIANVTNDLHLYRDGLKQRVKCDPSTSQGQPIPEILCSDCGTGTGTYPRKKAPAGNRKWNHNPKTLKLLNLRKRNVSGEEKSESDRDIEYHPSPSYCGSSNSTPPSSPPPDNIEEGNTEQVPEKSTPSTTTILNKKVKSEPTSEAEDCDGQFQLQEQTQLADPAEANIYADEEDDDDFTSKFQLCETSGVVIPRKRNRGRPRIKRNLANVIHSPEGLCHSWKKITMTEEELEENFRKQGNKNSTSSKQVIHYCAHGRPRMACPVKVKVKELANGVRITFQNNMKHREHRKYVVGLTKKQKDFVDDCFRQGVTRPADILLSFKHEGLEEPPMAKLRGYLTRFRGKQKNKSIVEEMKETPPEEIPQSMQCSKVEADRDEG